MTATETPENRSWARIIWRVSLYAWLAAMFVIVLLSARVAYRKALNTEEYAYSCDQFGYLRMAKEIRSAVAERRSPQFKLESPQTRELIEFMKSRNVPLPQWEEMVAPHAHHYFPRSDAVAVQYPPGTGLALSIFPEGRAVFDLNRVVVWVLAAVGILALIVAVVKKAWTSAALVALAAEVGLLMLARVGTVSFSINASLLPLLTSVLLALAALRFRAAGRTPVAWIVALVAGLTFGFAIFVRITTVMMLPALILLLWPKSKPLKLTNLVLPLTLGAVLVGVLPVLLYQQQISGAWYLPTYGRIDATPPTVSRLEHHFLYYFGDEFAAADNWALLCAVLGFAGFVLLLRESTVSNHGNRFGLSWQRLGLAAFAWWTLPTIFFLSHAVHGLHYQMPGTFGAVALIGFGALAIEGGSRAPRKGGKRRLLVWAAGLTLIIVFVASSVIHLWREGSTAPAPAQPISHQAESLPAELTDSHAWLWADLLTGTLWYYHQKPAFKIQFSDPQTRALLFKYVFDRGDRQYLVQDSERMQTYMNEIAQLGGSLELRGKIEGQPYFLVHWPPTGPEIGKASRSN
ncbi:MAG TPA: hypothetical protein VIF81_12200 [Pyrinomonadaceae bacterium]